MHDVEKWGLPEPELIRRAAGERTPRLVSWRPWHLPNQWLLGHVEVDFNGWIVREVPIFRKADGGLSVAAPSVPKVRDGVQLRNTAGKPDYDVAIRFVGDGKRRWERAVLDALAAGGIEP